MASRFGINCKPEFAGVTLSRNGTPIQKPQNLLWSWFWLTVCHIFGTAFANVYFILSVTLHKDGSCQCLWFACKRCVYFDRWKQAESRKRTGWHRTSIEVQHFLRAKRSELLDAGNSSLISSSAGRDSESALLWLCHSAWEGVWVSRQNSLRLAVVLVVSYRMLIVLRL